MIKRNKKSIVTLVAISIIVLVIATTGYLSFKYLFRALRSQFVVEEFMGKSVSPNGRWKIKTYVSSGGAMTRSSYYAVVTDQKGRVPIHEIGFDGSKFKLRRAKFRWKSNVTLLYYGLETNIRTNTVLLGTSVSPGGRWRVKVYDIFPIGQRYGSTYAEFVDLKTDLPPREIILEKDQILGYYIRWKSANEVNIYGQVVDVRERDQWRQKDHSYLYYETKLFIEIFFSAD